MYSCHSWKGMLQRGHIEESKGKMKNKFLLRKKHATAQSKFYKLQVHPCVPQSNVSVKLSKNPELLRNK